MLKLKRFFICLLLSFLLFSSSVLATDTDSTLTSNVITTETEKNDSIINTVVAESIYEDLYIYNTDSYTIDDNIYGNVFASTLKLTTNPRHNGGVISGNLFAISNNIVIGSDVSYSNNKDMNGNYLISSINSKSVINGNMYAITDSFTLEAGSEIKGDLYIISTKDVIIEQDTIIDGNIFITASNVKLNGQVAGSAYITADNFTMDYLGYISRDLYLDSQDASLSGIVYRNAYVTAYNTLQSTTYFRANQNLSVNYANDFIFSGEVKGNAIINAKNLNIDNTEDKKCIINGNLKYCVQNDITLPDNFVVGEVSKGEFNEINNNTFSIKTALLNFFTLLVYTFIVVLLSIFIAPNAIKTITKINVKNITISFLVGFASLFAVIILMLILLISGAGIFVSLILFVAYLFVLGIGLPLLLYDIVNIFKWKFNLYIKLLIVVAVFYIISILPVVGPIFTFITLFIGTGRIFLSLFKRKPNI